MAFSQHPTSLLELDLDVGDEVGNAIIAGRAPTLLALGIVGITVLGDLRSEAGVGRSVALAGGRSFCPPLQLVDLADCFHNGASSDEGQTRRHFRKNVVFLAVVFV